MNFAFLSIGAGVALFAACGGSDNAETISGTPKPAVTVTSASNAVPAAPTTAPTEEPPPTSDRLQRLALKIEDLPSGWTTMPPDTDDSNTQICNRPPASTQFKPSANAEADYQQSDFGPFLVHVLASYSATDARRAMDYVAEMLKACTEWTQTSADGTKVTFRLSPLSFTKLGDETFAVRMSTRDVPLFGTAQFDLVFWRRSGLVSYMAYAAVGPAVATASPLEDLAKKVDARLKGPFK